MSPSNAGGEGEKGKEREGEREKDVACKKNSSHHYCKMN